MASYKYTRTAKDTASSYAWGYGLFFGIATMATFSTGHPVWGTVCAVIGLLAVGNELWTIHKN